jgi:hypothetical protein
MNWSMKRNRFQSSRRDKKTRNGKNLKSTNLTGA